MDAVTFIARFVNSKGQVTHGELKAPLDPDAATEAAKKQFPQCRILAVYPKEMHHREAWMRQFWLKALKTEGR
ncbi:hypothetical protein J2S00_003045 [Caldalkalibacillus uzonensis]|uniref:Uncharacterized protein n=1 Tax=Caldalkalibacillus uzonensis TaxID=353224 RepID=A0ABU0CUZ0_9BACI|nr:hypothetical protein [Caldalkalibacillus uzonensis]MDQ0340240.1 hypothetical protein [Caldalkalibacillus uzonensis]